MYTYSSLTLNAAAAAASASNLSLDAARPLFLTRKEVFENSVAELTIELERLGGLSIVAPEKPPTPSNARLFAESSAFLHPSTHSQHTDVTQDEGMLLAMDRDDKNGSSRKDRLRKTFTNPNLPRIKDFLDAYGEQLPGNSIASLSDEDSYSFLRYVATNALLPIAQNCLHRLRPEQKAAIRAVADIIAEDNIFVARKFYRALHAFDKLRAIASIQNEGEDVDLQNAAFDLEDYDAIRSYYEIGGSLDHRIAEHAVNYREKLGYSEGVLHDAWPNALLLARLIHEYDIVVPIARGGLSLGAMAELLGAETRAIEVHAHGRDIPESRFLEEIWPEDIAEKKVLLLDKDVVSGASVMEAERLLAPFNPASISVYLAFPPVKPGQIGSVPSAIAELEKSGITVYHSKNVEPATISGTFYELHKHLGTMLGRLKSAVSRLCEIESEAQEIDQTAAKHIGMRAKEQEILFFALNHLLPGMENVREGIVRSLEGVISTYEGNMVLSNFLGDPPHVALRRLERLITSMPALPIGAAEELARSRYLKEGKRLAQTRSIENPHIPHSYTASFESASRAAADGYDYALIVGPEGFAYEPMFQDLGVKTVAVNIPEADFGGKRTIKTLDDLKALKGKRVLVIEDDVQSGATLKKLLRALKGRRPKFLGLYLGSPPLRQMRENIPGAFRKVYQTGESNESADDLFMRHLEKREVLLKRPLKKSPFRKGAKRKPRI